MAIPAFVVASGNYKNEWEWRTGAEVRSFTENTVFSSKHLAR